MSQRTIYFCDKCCEEIAEGQKIYSVDVRQYVVNKGGSVRLDSSKGMELCSHCAESIFGADFGGKDAEGKGGLNNDSSRFTQRS